MKKILTLYTFKACCLVPAPLFATPLDAGFLYLYKAALPKEKDCGKALRTIFSAI